MKYCYKFGNREYIVVIESEKETGIEIKFISRVNGGKGRLPRNKLVKKDTLIPLINSNEIIVRN